MPKLLYKISGRFVKIDEIGNIPGGERKNFHFMGDCEGEQLKGTLRGVDYALTKDGTVHIHIHELFTTDQGEKITIERNGHSLPSEDPDMILLEGTGRAGTGSSRLAWLNEVPIVWKAWINRKDVHFSAEVYHS
ncbi:DUF3237 domain-containing protein [Brevibacillus humidisoli]|uniref:DUF3237 family protein n=1 Tax=Brevibacillus humidisoli TaxID=2895522 RepID=UPI001E30ACF9|nr:DUF3237 family protein [Brevibacillus humidisoli]UFJ42573.1 DUF3237 domain-containing protein [Brevibacillus humidisoli]